MIEVRELCAGYRGKEVLHNVSLTFPAGCVTVLLGPNGCGKSTLLRTILGLQPSSSGQIRVDGTALDRLSPRRLAQKAAYLPQSRGIPNISAFRMVLHGRFPYLPYPRRYRKEDYQIAGDALRLVGAEDLAECFLPELSGGQRQKVYFAMAMAQGTPAVLMDEPTTYLDIQHQLEVMRISKELASGGTCVVLVLHDLCLAMKVADQVAVMEHGRVVGWGTPEEIYAADLLSRVFAVRVRRVQTESGWQYYCT